MVTISVFLSLLDEIRKEYKVLRSKSQYDDISDQSEADLVRLSTRALAAVARIAGDPSAYQEQCTKIMNMNAYTGLKVLSLVGVIESLRADVAAGYLQSQKELVHGEIFSDFLEMSKHLLDEGYKDPAAVVAGSSLEAHLRQLCIKSGIDVEFE